MKALHNLDVWSEMLSAIIVLQVTFYRSCWILKWEFLKFWMTPVFLTKLLNPIHTVKFFVQLFFHFCRMKSQIMWYWHKSTSIGWKVEQKLEFFLPTLRCSFMNKKLVEISECQCPMSMWQYHLTMVIE